MQEARPFFHRVESLRGIGTVLVATWHLSGWVINGVTVLPHQPWAAVGWLQNAIGRFELMLLPHASVMVFFVISGCVLRVSLQYGPQEPSRALVRFHVARFFRLYPVVMLSMLVAAFAHGCQLPGADGQPPQPLTAAMFLANLFMLDVSLNSTLWAIQLEVVMAPIIAALYFLERRHGPWALVAVAAVTSVLSLPGGWTPWSPLSQNMFAFVLGMLVPTLGRERVQNLSPRALNALLVVCVVGLFATGAMLGFFSRYTRLLEGYFAFGLVAIAAYRIDLRALRLLDAAPVQAIGRASGSYYVLHMPLFVWIVPAIAMLIPPALSLSAPALAGPLILALAALVLALPALASYHLVEAPGIALGRRLIATARLRPAH
jgi:peptidoglycan/LPS O-acetylase OafA/YrhL